MPIPLIAGIAAGAGLLGSMLTPSPDWNDVSFEGLNADDDRYYMKGLKDNAFGQDTATANMSRYGFEGTYQKFLQGEAQRMKDEEQRRIMRMSSNLVPGQAALRGGLASQGLGGATSNVMAKQQREAGMGKALDTGLGAYEASANRLDSQFLNLTGQNEAMRYGASQDLMKAQGLQTQAGMDVNKYNAGARQGIMQFNSQGSLQANIANSQGRFQADNASSQKWQGMFGQMATAGFGMIGNQLGMDAWANMQDASFDNPIVQRYLKGK